MSLDFNGANSDHVIRLELILACCDPRKYPFLSGSSPVFHGQPLLGFLGMPLPEHAPELFIDIVVNTSKGLRSNHMPVVIRPTTQDFVELFDKNENRSLGIFSDQCSHFLADGRLLTP